MELKSHTQSRNLARTIYTQRKERLLPTCHSRVQSLSHVRLYHCGLRVGHLLSVSMSPAAVGSDLDLACLRSAPQSLEGNFLR